MREGHRGLNLCNKDFDRFIEILMETLIEFNIEEKLI